MSTIHGVALLADQRYEAPIIQAIQARSDTLAIVRRCADLAEVIAAARAGVADLAVVDGADPDLTAEAIHSLRESGMSVIALAPHGDRARLSALGVASVAAPGSPEQVVNSLIAATKTPRVPAAPTCPPTPTPPPSPPGSVLAVWGTSGAPGRTTLAAGIATVLARTAPTLLVDADTGNPTVAHLLGLPVHASGLSVLARAASRGPITPQDVAAASLERARNLSIITGLATPHRWREVSRSGIAAIVAAARRGTPWRAIQRDRRRRHLPREARARSQSGRREHGGPRGSRPDHRRRPRGHRRHQPPVPRGALVGAAGQ